MTVSKVIVTILLTIYALIFCVMTFRVGVVHEGEAVDSARRAPEVSFMALLGAVAQAMAIVLIWV